MKPLCRSAQLALLAAALLPADSCPDAAGGGVAAGGPATAAVLHPGARRGRLPAQSGAHDPSGCQLLLPPATIHLAATAADEDGRIAKVEFYNGATLLATVLTPPYQFTWNNVGVGTYSLTAKAYSTRGLSKTSPAANVTVSVNQLPVVSLLTPANNSAVGPAGNVSLSAIASDPDGVLARVEFYRDSARVATTFDSPPVAEAYGLAPGVYNFTARAIDNRGGTAVN